MSRIIVILLSLPIMCLGADTPKDSTTSAVALDGAEPWQTATSIDSFQFPWWTTGAREGTTARLLWDDEYLYVAFVATDAHISFRRIWPEVA